MVLSELSFILRDSPGERRLAAYFSQRLFYDILNAMKPSNVYYAVSRQNTGSIIYITAELAC